MRKKAVSFILIISLICCNIGGALLFSSAQTDEKQMSFNSANMFSATQGIWKYQTREAVSGVMTDMTFDVANSRWTSGADFALIWPGFMHTSNHASATFETQTALSFVAPYTGTIKINMGNGAVTPGLSSANGVYFCVLYNNASWLVETKVIAQGSSYQFAEQVMEVTVGDRITFLLGAYGGNNNGDTTEVNPIIDYTSVEDENAVSYKAKEMFTQTQSDTQGTWRYLMRDINTNIYTELAFNGTYWIDNSGSSIVSSEWMHPNANGTYQTVLEFVAPSSGTVNITSTNGVTVGASSADGVRLWIWVNDSFAYQSETISAGQNIDFGEINQLVSKGDRIRFILIANSSNAGDATTIFPVVTYTSVNEDGDTTIDYAKYLSDIWTGNTVYDESVMVISNQSGIMEPISLLYKIDTIVSVKSATLKVQYTSGVDYILQSGKLVIPEDSSIPVMSYADYYPATASTNSFPCTNGGNIYFAEGSYFQQKQIVVTYTHSDKWTGSTPSKQLQKLLYTKDKLKNGNPLSFVFYGDSITVGANVSGYTNTSPYLPNYADMTVLGLKQAYPAASISSVNSAVGGTGSVWGLQNIQDKVIKYNPDLVVLGFGMNDGAMNATDFKANIKRMIAAIRQSKPHCEFVLVATMLPNAEVSGFLGNQGQFLAKLLQIADEYKGVAVADMTTMHTDLLKLKRFYDMTGNNVNHANDFLERVYAQVMLTTLSGEKGSSSISDKDIYSFASMFSGTQGTWRYLLRDIYKNTYQELKYDGTKWMDASSSAIIGSEWMHPHYNGVYQTVLEFVAPKTGIIEIFDANGGVSVGASSADGIKLWIWQNDGFLYQTDVVLAGKTVNYGTVKATVKAGDKVRFILVANNSNAGDVTQISPVIKYTSYTIQNPKTGDEIGFALIAFGITLAVLALVMFRKREIIN